MEDLKAQSTEHHTSLLLHFVLLLYQPVSIHLTEVYGSRGSLDSNVHDHIQNSSVYLVVMEIFSCILNIP